MMMTIKHNPSTGHRAQGTGHRAQGLPSCGRPRLRATTVDTDAVVTMLNWEAVLPYTAMVYTQCQQNAGSVCVMRTMSLP